MTEGQQVLSVGIGIGLFIGLPVGWWAAGAFIFKKLNQAMPKINKGV